MAESSNKELVSAHAARLRQIKKEDEEVEEFILNGPLLTANYRLHPYLYEKILGYIEVHKNTVYAGFDVGNMEFFYPLSTTRCNLYDQDGALAFTNYHLFKTVGGCRDYIYIQEALRLLERHIRHVTLATVSFITGDAGLLSLGAVLYHHLGKTLQCRKLLDRLAAEAVEVCLNNDLNDDLMNGRAGYLFALLFARKEIGSHLRPIPEHVILQVFMKIIQVGRETAEKEKRGEMLFYRCSNRSYLGARSGMAGILHTLMLTDLPGASEVLTQFLGATLDYMLTQKLESGNRPTDDVSKADVFSAWCHGASGWVHCFLKAYQYLGETRFLDAAKEMEELVWTRGYRGILKGRHSLCHGMPGNGYCHLALFKATREVKYAQRACLVGLKCFRYNSFLFKPSLKPYSLFDGLCGTVCFLSDLLDPTTCAFPCFEL